MAEAGPLGIERRGIDYIPSGERWAKPSSLFWMWSGALFNVEILVYGAVLFGFGFTFFQALSLILIGNLTYLLLGLTSLQGPEAGTTTFTINRAAFGSNGSKFLAFFNWLTQVGFETYGVALLVLAALALAQNAGDSGANSSTILKIVLLVAAGLIQLVLPLFGHQIILKTLRVLFWPFLVLFIIFAVLTVSKAKLHGVAHAASWGTWFEGLAFVMTTSGLGWTENGNDYSRYLPRGSSPKAIVGSIFLGSYIPSILLMTLGAAVATFVGSKSGSVPGMATAFSSWFLWPFLLVAIVQIFAINSLDLYSSGVTLQALGLKFSRWQAVILDTVICTILAGYALFSNSFNNLLNDFVLFIIVWVGPWTAIYLVDWLLRKKRYSAYDLQLTSSGIYYRGNGIHWPAIIAQLLGMGAAMLTIDAYPHYVSIVSNATDGSDFSAFAGVLVGGIAYFLLARTSVKAEAALQKDATDEEIAAIKG